MDPSTASFQPQRPPASTAAGQQSSRLPESSIGQASPGETPDADTGSDRRHRKPHPIAHIAIALTSAVLVGSPLVFLQRPQYRCVSTLAIAGEPTPQQVQRYRFELLDHAREQFARTDELGPTSRRWFVNSPGPQQLRLGVDFSNPQEGIAKVRRVAESYCRRMATHAAGALATQSDAELILGERAQTLRSKLDIAQEKMDVAQSILPQHNPTDGHLALIDRWGSLESQFASARDLLFDAKNTATSLERSPSPHFAVVSKEDRDNAFKEDRALSQDLRELQVNLTELKLHLLNVWQQSAGPLEPLSIAVDDLINVVAPERIASLEDSDRKLLERVKQTAKQYKTELSTFEKTWHREFTSLRSMQADPRNDGILNVYQSVRGSLRDFLFDGSKRLSKLRTDVRSFSLGSADTAKYHVLRSNLTRAFQAVQTTHHRFEFAAGAIETPHNFRLDAALLGARGLRRRSRERINAIETRLQTLAIEKARQKQSVDLADAKKHVEDRRDDVDEVVNQLIILQGSINQSANDIAAYHQAAKRAQVTRAQWNLLNDETHSIDAQLMTLQQQREAQAAASHVTVVSCKSLGSSANLNERIRVGAMAACLTFLVVFLGQWLVRRRWTMPL